MVTITESIALQMRPILTDTLNLQLVVFSRDGKLWVDRDTTQKPVLPQVTVPRWRRVAQEAVLAARTCFNLEIFCLWEMRDNETIYLVGEILEQANTHHNLASISTDQLNSSGLSDVVVRVVAAAQKDMFSSSGSGGAEPFKKLGWLTQMQQQLQNALDGTNRHLTGEVEQLNASPTFSLLKLSTTTTPVWFKAVGEPNLAEYSLTIALNRLFPGIGPTILVTFPQWHGWVTEDSRGQPLDHNKNFETWEDAITRLADLQIVSLKHLEALLDLGCKDARTPALIGYIDQFLDAVHSAMDQDPEVKSPRLDSGQLGKIAEAIKRATCEIDRLGVPNALVHRDLSGDNIQVSPSGCHFLDWAQACIGHPFICSEYIQVHFIRAINGSADPTTSVKVLADAYALRWSGVLTAAQVQAARAHSPLLAKYLYMLPMDGRSLIDLLHTREHRASLRSMARRMWRDVCGSGYSAS